MQYDVQNYISFQYKFWYELHNIYYTNIIIIKKFNALDTVK